ncbi:MAG: polynucleotide adenylyltransferase PcnB [Desulfomonilia bacterium]|nr:polynucleotide adenylyltransferase PcnB [Desulfomonilia bacterium]
MTRQRHESVVLKRSDHRISRKDIDPDALKVLYRLYRKGHTAYLVGGAVRDLLLGRKPKDFDVVTDARPGQIKKLFANCFLIGRRFRLAHIRFRGGKIIEVATFRREPEEGSDVLPEGNNTFGTPREDAFRRDITINALFYNISNFTLIDYVGGLEDLEHRRVCVIGEPETRYREDPVRIWRVIRHAGRQGFTIEERTADAIESCRELLATCSGARLFEELNKDLTSGYTADIFSLGLSFRILHAILGGVGEHLERSLTDSEQCLKLLGFLDTAVRNGHAPPSQEFMFSLLFFPWAHNLFQAREQQNGDRIQLLTDAILATGMTITLPKALRSQVIQILFILEHMLAAARTGRMRWALKKRGRYHDASRLFALVVMGQWSEKQDPFESYFRETFKTDAGKKRRRKTSRYSRSRKKGSTSPTP